LPTSMVLTG